MSNTLLTRPAYQMDLTLLRALPADLRALGQFVTWRYEDQGKPKLDKVPYNPRTGGKAMPNVASTWGSFESALAAAFDQAHDGIGVMLDPALAPLCGLDLDECVASDGTLTEEAQRTLAEADSYAEYSPSGTGIRILCWGAKPAGRCKDPIRKLEMYNHGRFLTLTGQRVPGAPATINERSAALALIHGRWFPAPAPRPPATSNTDSPALSDDQILSKARVAKNGPKFIALFDNGDTSTYGADDSSADLALCGLLTFYTQDRTQIDRLFRRSALYRDKWDRVDYRDRTITKALSESSEHYTGPARPAVPDVPYHPADPPSTNGTPPPDAPTADEVTVFDRDGEHLSDMGNASRLARMQGRDLRYAKGWGWVVYDGARWARDTTGTAMRAAKATVRGMYQEASSIPDDRNRTAFAKWALQSESAGRLTAMLALAESEKAVACTTDDFDADPYLLNCENGTVNLHTGELRPHDRADLITKLAPVEYDPKAECPTWRAFLARIFEPVPEVIPFLQRAIGYALTGDTSEQVMFLLFGTGANGKSTLLQTLAAILGDYAQATPAATLMVRDRNNNATNDLARMAGARLVTAIESDEGKRLAEGLIKQMTGNDKIVARYLHQEFFEFTPLFKLFLATNHKPIIRGTDYAIWRRIHLVPFLVTIPPEERDPYLTRDLIAEAPGILAWAVAGYQIFRRSGLQPPAAITNATSDYRAEMDLLAAFLNECCVVERTMMVGAGTLYDAYKAWAVENGERPITQRAFSLRLQERDYYTERRGAGGKLHWIGLGLISHAE